MANIKKLKDNNNNTVYPITSTQSIWYMPEDQSGHSIPAKTINESLGVIPLIFKERVVASQAPYLPNNIEVLAFAVDTFTISNGEEWSDGIDPYILSTSLSKIEKCACYKIKLDTESSPTDNILTIKQL